MAMPPNWGMGQAGSGTLRVRQDGQFTLRPTTHSKIKAFLWFREVSLASLNICARHWQLHDVNTPSQAIILLICSCDSSVIHQHLGRVTEQKNNFEHSLKCSDKRDSSQGKIIRKYIWAQEHQRVQKVTAERGRAGCEGSWQTNAGTARWSAPLRRRCSLWRSTAWRPRTCCGALATLSDFHIHPWHCCGPAAGSLIPTGKLLPSFSLFKSVSLIWAALSLTVLFLVFSETVSLPLLPGLWELLLLQLRGTNPMGIIITAGRQVERWQIKRSTRHTLLLSCSSLIWKQKHPSLSLSVNTNQKAWSVRML